MSKQTLSIFVQAGQFGGWIELTALDTVDSIREEIEELLCEGEDFAITDSDGFGFSVPEHADLGVLMDLVDLNEERGQVALVVYQYLNCELCKDLHTSALHEATNASIECIESLESWGREQWELSGWLDKIPEDLQDYVDFQAWADSQLAGGVVSRIVVGNDTYIWTR